MPVVKVKRARGWLCWNDELQIPGALAALSTPGSSSLPQPEDKVRGTARSSISLRGGNQQIKLGNKIKIQQNPLMTNFHLRKWLGGNAKTSNKNSTKATSSTENQQTRDVPDQMLLAEKAPSAGDAPAKGHCWSEPGAQQVSRASSPEQPHPAASVGFLFPLQPPAFAGRPKLPPLWLAGAIPSPQRVY